MSMTKAIVVYEDTQQEDSEEIGMKTREDNEET